MEAEREKFFDQNENSTSTSESIQDLIEEIPQAKEEVILSILSQIKEKFENLPETDKQVILQVNARLMEAGLPFKATLDEEGNLIFTSPDIKNDLANLMEQLLQAA